MTSSPDIFDSAKVEGISKLYTFNYANKITSPAGLEITSTSDISSNIGILKTYDDYLMSGVKSGALGSKYFAPTGMNCIDDSQNTVNRSLYINSVRPAESSSGSQGLVPSIITDLQEINPYNLYAAFSGKSLPKCTMISMETTNNDDTPNSVQSGYVANSEIEQMNACWFQATTDPITSTSAKINPLTDEQCMESFSNISNMPDDTFIKAYFFSLGILGFYILAKITTK